MNSQEIAVILSRVIMGTGTNFLGVFPSNEIPMPTSFPSCYVANIDPNTLPGSHWVAFYYIDSHHLEFLDSYGMPPSLYQFHLPRGVLVLHNQVEIQKLNSTVCGQYCIFYLFHRARGSSLFKISKHLANIKSDQYVRRYVHSLRSALHYRRS